MFKNNIKAFLIHGVINYLSFVIFLACFGSTPKWVSEEAQRQYYFKMRLFSVIIIVIAVLLYIFLSKKFLKNQGSIIKNLLSVSSVGIVGSMLWGITLIALTIEGGISKSQSISFYYIYISYLIPLISTSVLDYNFYLISLVFSFVPSIFMIIGIFTRKIKP